MMYKFFNGLNDKRGMSILEILIAISIISFVCVPAIQVIYSLHSNYIIDIVRDIPIGFKTALQGNSNQQILDVVYHGDGGVRTILKSGGMLDVHSIADKQYSESQQKPIEGIHTRQTCTDFNISTQSSQLSSTYLKPLTPPALYLYTSDELGQGTSTKLTDIAFVGDNLFISTDSASTSLPDIYSYSINTSLYGTSTPFSYSVLNPASTHTKPTLTITSAENTAPGISQIQSIGAYLLMANTGVKSQVSVSKIGAELWGANASAGGSIGLVVDGLKSRTDFTIPGSNSNTSPITKVILNVDGRIIVGTEKSVLPEIFVFDVYTGQPVGSIETGYGVNDILVANNLLIVAGPRDPEIEVFDINTFLKVGQYDLQGGSGNAKVLNIFGDQLYIGRTKGGNELEVLTIERIDSNPMTPFAPVFSPLFNKKIQWSVDALLKYEEYSLLFTADEYSEFQLYADDLGNRNGGSNGTILQYKVDLPDRVSNTVCFKNSIWMTFKNANTTVGAVSPYRLGVLVF